MSEKKPVKPTVYRVLQKTGEGTFKVIKTGVEVKGGAGAAFKAVVKEPGEYVAVPESNWTEETLTFEQPPPKLVIAGHEAVQSTVDDQLASALDEVDKDVAAEPNPGGTRPTSDSGHSVRVPASPAEAAQKPRDGELARS